MVPPTKNSSITSFFKPIRQQAPETPSPQKSMVGSGSTGSRSSPALPSINVVIAASDGEDDDGDNDSHDDSSSDEDELEDFMAKFDPRRSTVQSPPKKASGTPRSKRTMTEHSSPSLAGDTRPQFLFDMNALMRDSQQDEATRTSYLKDKESREESQFDQAAVPKSSLDKDAVFLSVVKDKDGHNAQKVLRAIQRAEDSGPSRPRFCFFKSEHIPRAATKPSKKLRLSSSPWRLLTHDDEQTREQFLSSGIPTTLAIKGKNLPEELFQWALEDLCVSKSIIIREEYCRLLSIYPNHIKSLITPESLDQLLSRLGSLDIPSLKQDVLEISNCTDDPYAGRDWSNLRTFFELLSLIAESLSIASVEHVIHMLLKMSVDKFLLCNIDLVVEYEGTIQALLDCLPAPSWNSFCLRTAKILLTGFTINSLRLNSLLCLPISHARSRDFRRRLAAAFFFNDPDLAGREPSEVVTIPSCVARLKEAEFTITRKTEFEELKSSIIFLDMAIAGGSFSPIDGTEGERIFNEQVDELATLLASLTQKINDSGMKLARAEAKGVIEWVQKRISLSVRTKRQRKADIYQILTRAEDPSLPQQQAYMQNFLSKA